MKKYLLLRDNHEYGPYSLEELSFQKLKPADLIWLEGESTSWKYPIEIEELKNLVQQQTTPASSFTEKKKIFISLPSSFASKTSPVTIENYPPHENEPELETNLIHLPDEPKERFTERKEKKLWTKKFIPLSNALNITVVFIGLAVGAVVIKKMVDGFSEQSSTSGQENVATIISTQAPARENYQTAVTTNLNQAGAGIVEKAPQKTKLPDIRKQLKIKSNNYKVGIFGGINNLQLTVYNSSPHFVDKALVEIEYLKPNGEVIGSGQFQFNSIKAKSSKTLSIPATTRGVKLRYRIVNIYSHEYKASLKQV